MSGNRGVVYLGPKHVEVRNIDDPKFAAPDGRKIEHGVILKVVATNICGSDQHMVRGRTTAPAGMVLGHEITGEVITIRNSTRAPRTNMCSTRTDFLRKPRERQRTSHGCFTVRRPLLDMDSVIPSAR